MLRQALSPPRADARAITGMTADSRAVAPGCLFAALPGARADGRGFIADAVARGAAAVLAPQGTEWPAGVPPRPLIQDRGAAPRAGPHGRAAGRAAAGDDRRRHRHQRQDQHGRVPAPDLRPTGAGGQPRHAGRDRAGSRRRRGLTTPDPVALAETLAGLAREGVRFAAIEASSHGLDQFRLDGVRLAAAGFTNLTRDHLDYHGTMAAYRAAKLRLFASCCRAAPRPSSAARWTPNDGGAADVAARRLDLRTVGEDGDAIRLLARRPHPGGQTLELGRRRRRTIELPLPGRFQADNALLAAALAMRSGLPTRWRGCRGWRACAAGWSWRHAANGAAVYVDYAHTPDALERLLRRCARTPRAGCTWCSAPAATATAASAR